jgi:protocatechuate 3,4-dioxygenase beta subunit
LLESGDRAVIWQQIKGAKMVHDDHDKGLAHDLKVMRRRRVIGGLGLIGLGAVVATWARQSSGGEAELVATGPDGQCIKATSETPGPFPADGSNEIAGQVSNVLAEAGIQREDIRPSFGGLTEVADGIPLTIELQLQDVGNACAPLAGRAVYLWHCDAVGRYSLYEATEANYLRGVAVTDSAGKVTFSTILPGCYAGRWPHVHFEVFKDVAAATSGSAAGVISQLAFPKEIGGFYASDARYAASVGNLAELTLATDGIFADNTAAQMTAQTFAFGGDSAGVLAAAIVGVVV